jgi:hypothetical protein
MGGGHFVWNFGVDISADDDISLRVGMVVLCKERVFFLLSFRDIFAKSELSLYYLFLFFLLSLSLSLTHSLSLSFTPLSPPLSFSLFLSLSLSLFPSLSPPFFLPLGDHLSRDHFMQKFGRLLVTPSKLA